jgi:hypothetical protein
MRTDEFITFVRKVELSGFPVRIQLVACRDEYLDAMRLQASMDVKCRDTGAPICTYMVETISMEGVAQLSRNAAVRLVHDFLRRLLVHELDECFLVNGVRVYDPHENDRAPAAGVPLAV